MSLSFGTVLQTYSFVCLYFLIYQVTGDKGDKITEFVVKPGGVKHHFEQKLDGIACKFTYVCQGGTNEKWTMSITQPGDDGIFCSIERPERRSYLFFQQFALEVTGASVQDAQAFSAPGEYLKPEEFFVDKQKNQVVHVDGKFQSQLTRLDVKAAVGKKQEL